MSGTNPFKRRRADTAGHDDRALSTRLDAQNLAHRATPQSLYNRVDSWRTAAQGQGAGRHSPSHAPSITQTPAGPSSHGQARPSSSQVKPPSKMYLPEEWFAVDDEEGKIMRGKHGEKLKKWLRAKPSSWHRSFDDALEDHAKSQMDRYNKALKVKSLRETAKVFEAAAESKRNEALDLSHELGDDEEEDHLKATADIDRLFAGCMDEPVYPPGRPDWLDEELEGLDYWGPISSSAPGNVDLLMRGIGRGSSARTRQSAPAATPTGKVSETKCACKGSNANMSYRGSGLPCKLPCAGCSRFGAGCTAECACGGDGLCANKFNSQDGSRYGYVREMFGADAEGRFPNARTGVPEPIYPTGCFVARLWKELKPGAMADLSPMIIVETLTSHYTLAGEDTYDDEARKKMDAWRKGWKAVHEAARSPYTSQEEKTEAEADKKTLAQEMLRMAGAEDAQGSKHSWFHFSFCRNKWLDGSDTGMHHCWLCRRCVDGSMWHCGKCNTCRPAPRTPCFKCGGISRELAEASAASDGVS